MRAIVLFILPYLVPLITFGQTSFTSLETTGSNPLASVNGYINVLQFKNVPHAALVYAPGTSQELMFGFHQNGSFHWGAGPNAGNSYSMTLSKTGSLRVYNSVTIGSVSAPDYELAVGGDIIAESVNVKLKSNWPDYVFADNYNPASLDDLEAFIRSNNHLPEIPSAKDVEENGINLGEINAKLLQKIEELTLYLIEQDKKIALYDSKFVVYDSKLKAQQKEIDKLKKDR